MVSYTKDNQTILARLRGIEGQLKSIQQMVEEDKYCMVMLCKLSSVSATTQKVATIILQDHVRGCVYDALRRDEHSDDYVNELVTVVERFIRK